MKDYHGCTRINTDKRFRVFVYISLYLYICGITFPLLSSEMIKVPAGVYKPFIKVDAESATKPIPVKSFYLDKFPVTKKIIPNSYKKIQSGKKKILLRYLQTMDI